MKSQSKFALVLLAGSFLLAPAGHAQQGAQSAGGLEARVQRIERLIENQILREMLDKLEQIQRETRELRGELEAHNHRIEGLKRRQRELYIDVDRRLHGLERGATSTPTLGQNKPIPAPSQGSSLPPVPLAQDPAKRPQAATTAPQAAASQAARAGEHDAYEKAFNLLREGRYEQAEGAFKGFLEKFPAGRYSANAQYWLGEVFYLRRDFDKALEEFNKVVKDHPDSPKRANALLKIGFVNYEKGAWKEARSALESVVREHKGHSAARLAANRLNQMTQEGH